MGQPAPTLVAASCWSWPDQRPDPGGQPARTAGVQLQRHGRGRPVPGRAPTTAGSWSTSTSSPTPRSARASSCSRSQSSRLQKDLANGLEPVSTAAYAARRRDRAGHLPGFGRRHLGATSTHARAATSPAARRWPSSPQEDTQYVEAQFRLQPVDYARIQIGGRADVELPEPARSLTAARSSAISVETADGVAYTTVQVDVPDARSDELRRVRPAGLAGGGHADPERRGILAGPDRHRSCSSCTASGSADAADDRWPLASPWSRLLALCSRLRRTGRDRRQRAAGRGHRRRAPEVGRRARLEALAAAGRRSARAEPRPAPRPAACRGSHPADQPVVLRAGVRRRAPAGVPAAALVRHGRHVLRLRAPADRDHRRPTSSAATSRTSPSTWRGGHDARLGVRRRLGHPRDARRRRASRSAAPRSREGSPFVTHVAAARRDAHHVGAVHRLGRRRGRRRRPTGQWGLRLATARARRRRHHPRGGRQRRALPGARRTAAPRSSRRTAVPLTGTAVSFAVGADEVATEPDATDSRRTGRPHTACCPTRPVEQPERDDCALGTFPTVYGQLTLCPGNT